MKRICVIIAVLLILTGCSNSNTEKHQPAAITPSSTDSLTPTIKLNGVPDKGEGFVENDDNKYYLNVGNKIYKFNIEKDEYEFLCDVDFGYEGRPYDFAVKDNWVYYSWYNESDDTGKIYKARFDGSEKTVVSEDYGENLKIKDNYLYNEDYKKCTLERISLDGKTKEEYPDAKTGAPEFMGNYYFADKIYFIRNDDTLCEMNYDGTGVKQVGIGIYSDNITLYNGLIFTNLSPLYSDNGNCQLKQYDLTAKGGLKLLDEGYEIGGLTIYNDKIYYIKDDSVYRADTDGNNKIKLYDVDGIQPTVKFMVNAKLYYIVYLDNQDEELHSINLITGERKTYTMPR